MQKIHVNLKEKSYDIFLGNAYFDEIPAMILKQKHYNKLLIVTDEYVGELYLERLITAFSQYDTNVVAHVIPRGESSKSVDELMTLYSVLADHTFSRKDAIIALGGGVVGDLTGYAAATYLRGLDFIQVPTTLLSQVDSSVGGKVAINIPEGKNLVGSFYQPQSVFIDVDVLKTLDEREIKSGLAEVIKYACIYDAKLFKTLEKLTLTSLEKHYVSIIERCLQIKTEFVQQDERESYIRMHLNFGHTIGHGIEKYHNLKGLNHGEAVAMGMYYICKADMLSGHLDRISFEKIESLLSNYDLIFAEEYDLNKMMDYIAVDKKTESDSINIILLEKIGESVIKRVSLEWFKEFISEVI